MQRDTGVARRLAADGDDDGDNDDTAAARNHHSSNSNNSNNNDADDTRGRKRASNAPMSAAKRTRGARAAATGAHSAAARTASKSREKFVHPPSELRPDVAELVLNRRGESAHIYVSVPTLATVEHLQQFVGARQQPAVSGESVQLYVLRGDLPTPLMRNVSIASIEKHATSRGPTRIEYQIN
jgi:hypothetical protein